jgi:hypothetical protein
VPALIDALNNDPKSHVRIEAAHSLSKLRPVSQTIGEALEQAVARDTSMRVRLQARSALLQYHWAGYRGKKTDVPPLNTSREPPLAGDSNPPVISTKPGPSTTPGSTLPPPVLPGNQPRIQPVPVTPAGNVTPAVRPATTKEPPLVEVPPVPTPKPAESKPQEPTPKPASSGPELP